MQIVERIQFTGRIYKLFFKFANIDKVFGLTYIYIHLKMIYMVVKFKRDKT